MKIKIVADSSANLLELPGVEFESVPLTIRTEEREFVDTAELDIEEMANYFKEYKGKSGTSCPGVGDYLNAYEGYDYVYVVTIISKLSGSYNAAVTAAHQYEEQYPGRRVFVMDSFSTGSQMKLVLEKCRDLVLAGKDFDTVCEELIAYKEQHTSLVFCLESMHNLANNGRVKPAVAMLASILGIRVVGDVGDEGLHPTNKCRGEKCAVKEILNNMKRLGYKGGRLIIDHCFNEETAAKVKEAVRGEFPGADIIIAATRGLCTFYAERGGLIIGFEV